MAAGYIKASQELKGKDFISFAHVELDHVTLTIVAPSQSGQTWDFLDSIKLFAQVVGSTDPPVLVAELNPVPNGRTEIEIPGTGADISDIASADKFQISGEVSGRPWCSGHRRERHVRAARRHRCARTQPRPWVS